MTVTTVDTLSGERELSTQRTIDAARHHRVALSAFCVAGGLLTFALFEGSYDRPYSPHKLTDAVDVVSTLAALYVLACAGTGFVAAAQSREPEHLSRGFMSAFIGGSSLYVPMVLKLIGVSLAGALAGWGAGHLAAWALPQAVGQVAAVFRWGVAGYLLLRLSFYEVMILTQGASVSVAWRESFYLSRSRHADLLRQGLVFAPAVLILALARWVDSHLLALVACTLFVAALGAFWVMMVFRLQAIWEREHPQE